MQLDVNIIYGNHGHAIHTEDTFEYVREGLASTGLRVGYSSTDYLMQGVNIVLESQYQDMYERLCAARQACPQSRLYVIVSEVMTPRGFNSANVDMAGESKRSSHYDDGVYWNERTRAFMRLVTMVDGLILIGLETVDGRLPDGQDKLFGAYFQLGKPVHLIPLCASPSPSAGIAGQDRYDQDIDILFTGTVTPYRREILDKLRAKNLKVVVLDAHTAGYLRNNYVRRSKLSVGLRLSEETELLSLMRAYFHLVNRVPHVFERTSMRSPFDPFLNFAERGDAFIEACIQLLTGERPFPDRCFSEFYYATRFNYRNVFERLRTAFGQGAPAEVGKVYSQLGR